MIDQQSLGNRILNMMREQLTQIGIPISQHIDPNLFINQRAKSRLGCCVFLPKKGIYRIEISSSLLERLIRDPEHYRKRMEEAIAHELLHTCCGCMNHGKLWKRYATQINIAFDYQVKRLATLSDEALQDREQSFRYKLRCNVCGVEFGRMRKSNLITQPHCYRCMCGGRLSRVL